jgi:hypothetical protein
LAVIERKNGRSADYVLRYNLAKEMFLKHPEKTLKEIAEECGVCTMALSRNLRAEGYTIEAPQNRPINDSVFEVIDTEEKAYWLGFLYADGNIKDTKVELSLQYGDINHLEKFREFMGLKNKIQVRTSKIDDKEYKSCRLSFRSKKVSSDLIKLGCVPRKSLVLKFPSDEQVPAHLKRHFMRGYIDGDGSLIFTEKTKCINIIGTEQFIVDFCNFFGLKLYTLSDVGPSGRNKRWQCYDISSLKDILDIFYGDCSIYLDRKYAIYTKFVDAVHARNGMDY